jgi:hypothetical protein
MHLLNDLEGDTFIELDFLRLEYLDYLEFDRLQACRSKIRYSRAPISGLDC